MPYSPIQQNTGSYVETTAVWDVSRIYEVDVTSPEFKELLVRLYQKVNNIAIALNTKKTGYYLEEEFVNGQLFFNPQSSNQLDLRASFTKLINIGFLAAGVTTKPHGLDITDEWKFTFINGAASDTLTFTYVPLPFAGATGNNIEVRLDATNVIITNNSGDEFTDAYIILEYLKN